MRAAAEAGGRDMWIGKPVWYYLGCRAPDGAQSVATVAQNLFSSLLKYASYQYKEPKENIVSGAFAFLMAEVPQRRTAFVRTIQRKYHQKYPRERLPRVDARSMFVQTQSTYHRRRLKARREDLAHRDMLMSRLGATTATSEYSSSANLDHDSAPAKIRAT